VEDVCDDVTLIHEGRILLSGDLDEIRREEGQNKLFLSVLSADETWERDLKAAFPTLLISPADDGLILDTQGTLTQGEIMAWLGRKGLVLRRFGLYEPSLNDIFIQKAGD